MLLGDLICSDYFDLNCNYTVCSGTWNDGGEAVWSTASNGYHRPPCVLLDQKITYITISNGVLIIEIAPGFRKGDCDAEN